MKEYFSHDYNARNDRKITALVQEYRAAGYGIFWATGEMMHEEGDKLEYDELTFGAIAKDLNENVDFVKEVIDKCIEKYKLFLKQETKLTSSRVKQNLSKKEAKRSTKEAAGRLGGINSGKSRRSKQNEAVLQANELYKSKEDKSKEDKSKLKEEDFIFWENEKTNFLNSGDWIFKFCRDKDLVLEIFDERAKIFLSDIELREDFKDVKELKNHFTNWYNSKYIKNGHKSINGIDTKLGTSAARTQKASQW